MSSAHFSCSSSCFQSFLQKLSSSYQNLSLARPNVSKKSEIQILRLFIKYASKWLFTSKCFLLWRILPIWLGRDTNATYLWPSLKDLHNFVATTLQAALWVPWTLILNCLGSTFIKNYGVAHNVCSKYMF